MHIQLQTGAGSPWNRVQMAAQAFNRSAWSSVKASDPKTEEERRDRLSLSPMGRFQSQLESLMTQKQNIIEQKNQLIADTLDAGGDTKSIQSMISLYEEQISNIETQISQTMKEMVEERLDEKDEDKVEKEPETKEELQRRQMNELSGASMDFERTGQIYSAHVHKKGEASALASEIELDGGRGGAAPGKQERLNELLKEADELYGEAMKGYAKLNVSLKESAEEASHHHELESEEEAAEKGPGLLEKEEVEDPEEMER